MILFQHIILVSTFILHSCAAFLLRPYSALRHSRAELSLSLSKQEKYSSSDELTSRQFIKRNDFITALTFLGFTPLVSNADGTEEGAYDSKDTSSVKERTLVKGIVQLKAG